VFIQVDDTERTMTDEEYEAWVAASVEYINEKSTRTDRAMKTLAILTALFVAVWIWIWA
jgi:hypothetical protein